MPRKNGNTNHSNHRGSRHTRDTGWQDFIYTQEPNMYQEDIVPGDVVLCKFEGRTAGEQKSRPAVVLAQDEWKVSVLPITSSLVSPGIVYWDLQSPIEAGLDKPCAVLAKVRTVDFPGDIIRVLGAVSDYDWEGIQDALSQQSRTFNHN